MPTDEVLEEIDEFHANLKVALDWVSSDPERGLRLLHLVARPWESSGRAPDAMNAADLLVGPAPSDSDPSSGSRRPPVPPGSISTAWGPDAGTAVLHRVSEVAHRAGDDYYIVLANWGLEAGTGPEVIERHVPAATVISRQN